VCILNEWCRETHHWHAVIGGGLWRELLLLQLLSMWLLLFIVVPLSTSISSIRGLRWREQTAEIW
jgi:hypothetical protein